MSTDAQDWEKIRQYLEPRRSDYWVEEPSITQKVFLKTEAQEVLFGGAAGGGKLISLDEVLPTPEGFKKVRDIEVGNTVFGRNGKTYTVLAMSEIQNVPGWKFTFDDGSTVVTNDEHLWLTYDAKELEALTKRNDTFRTMRRQNRPSRATGAQGQYKSIAVAERNKVESIKNRKPPPTGTVRTTQEIVDTLTVRGGRANHAIPVTLPLELASIDLPIDPYTLGAWLGDGFSRSGTICGVDKEIWENTPYAIKSSRPRSSGEGDPNYRVVTLENLTHLLKENNLLNNKHIPNDYLWASEEQRLELLQGLMDTDGNVSKSSVEFTNTNKGLVDGVAHLARSLGMKVNVREGRAKLYGQDCGPKWMVKFAANRIVFKLPRKAESQSIATRRTNNFRYIKKAERVEATDMRCFKVSAPDELFLCTENLIPTHNSSALIMAALQYVDVPGYSAILFRRTYADLALPGALMDRFRDWIMQYDDVHWNANQYTATFPSGARITFGYLNNVNDYLRYKGPLAPDTEVMTDNGWKRIDEIQVGEKVASMDPETRTWDYKGVTHVWEYDVDEPLYSPRPGSDVSFASTGDHTWWVSTQRRKDLKKYRTEDLPKVARFPQAAMFSGGINPGAALFPRSSRGHQRSKDLVFTAEDWAAFIGWYIAEGCTSGGEIHIALHDKRSRQEKDNLKLIIERSGGHVYDNPRYLQTSNKKLAQWLDENTGKGAHNKRIPDEVFTWTSDLTRVLLQSLVEGDGTWRTPESAHYVTVSKQLADDVMRLAQHCGFRATLDVRQDSTVTPDGKKRRVTAYHVYLLYKVGMDTGISLNIDNQPLVATPYKGKVYCLTVPPYHTFLTRHNGRVVWTGNSEFQFIGMDEVTEIRESDYRYMFSRLRRPASGPLSQVPLRMRAATNPAPNWVRQRFLVEGEKTGRIFIPSMLTDNPGIDPDSYRAVLQELDPVERKRLEFGDWWSTALGSMFDRTSFEVIDFTEIPSFSKDTRIVRFWDLAGTEPSPSYPDPDWTVGCLAAFDNGVFYILDVRRIRAKGEKVEKFIRQTAEEDGVEISIEMEQEPGSAGKNLIDQYARYVLPGYDFKGVRATGDKLTRAKPMSAAVANGNVKLVRGAWNTDFVDELSAFPEAQVHDDQVDAAVHAFNTCAGLGMGLRKKIEIII